MRRREFLLGGAAAAWPLAARAQQRQSATARIGVLLQVALTEISVQPLWKALLEGLREHGWEEGKNLVIESRIGGRDAARFPELAAELAALNVDAILAANPHSIDAARSATSTIPVIMLGGVDPVRAGWLTSLSRPEGNLTGLASEYETLAGKHLELLKTLIREFRGLASFIVPRATFPSCGRKSCAASSLLGFASRSRFFRPIPAPISKPPCCAYHVSRRTR